MSKLFKTGLLSFLACTVLFQSALIGYTSDVNESPDTFEDINTTYYTETDEITEIDD